MLVSYNHRFIFLKTIKTAGTSIEMFLEPYCAPRGHEVIEARRALVTDLGIIGARHPAASAETWFNHMPAARVKAALGDDIWSSYRRITCIRDPFSKVVSWFHFYVCTAIAELGTMMARGDTIGAFRRWISGGAPYLPIDRQVYSIGGDVVADRIIRFERLDADLSAVCRELGLADAAGAPLGHHKRSAPRAAPLADYYDAVGLDVVNAVYDFEFRHFGYDRKPR